MSRDSSYENAEVQRFGIKVTSVGVVWSALMVWSSALALWLAVDRVADNMKRVADDLDLMLCIKAFEIGVTMPTCEKLRVRPKKQNDQQI